MVAARNPLGNRPRVLAAGLSSVEHLRNPPVKQLMREVMVLVATLVTLLAAPRVELATAALAALGHFCASPYQVCTAAACTQSRAHLRCCLNVHCINCEGDFAALFVLNEFIPGQHPQHVSPGCVHARSCSSWPCGR